MGVLRDRVCFKMYTHYAPNKVYYCYTYKEHADSLKWKTIFGQWNYTERELSDGFIIYSEDHLRSPLNKNIINKLTFNGSATSGSVTYDLITEDEYKIGIIQ